MSIAVLTPSRSLVIPLLVALALLLLSGCASVKPQSFVGPSGNQAYSMKCSGFGRDWDDCLSTAGELCPAGYSIIGQNSESVGIPTQNGLVIAPKRNLSIECE